MSPARLANILLRQANKEQPADPEAWLDALLTAKFDAASAKNGQLISTSVNGKSYQVAIPTGVSVADFMNAADYALTALENGWDRVPTTTRGYLRDTMFNPDNGSIQD